MFEEMRDLPKPSQPAPVVENVLKGVQSLKQQGVFLPQGVKAYALPGAMHLPIQDALGDLQRDVESLVKPESLVQFHFSGKGRSVKASRHIPGIGSVGRKREGEVMRGVVIALANISGGN